LVESFHVIALLVTELNLSLQTICRLLLHYFCEVTRRETVSRQLVDGLTRHIYSLTQSSPSAAGEELQSILLELHKKLFGGSKRPKKKNSFPGLDVVSVKYVSLACQVCFILEGSS
jgi:hypothetical protein